MCAVKSVCRLYNAGVSIMRLSRFNLGMLRHVHMYWYKVHRATNVTCQRTVTRDLLI